MARNAVQQLTEGSATIEVPTASLVTRDLEVFYNPVMQQNRDIAIALLGAYATQCKKSLQCCDAMAGSGVRAIRMLKELPANVVEHITINDCDERAMKNIEKNLQLNSITNYETWTREELFAHSIKTEGPGTRKGVAPIGRKKVVLPRVAVTSIDATTLLHGSNGFDYIDIDPFGSPNAFLDAACTRIARGGILAVTATDTSSLAGTHLGACRRKYWAEPCRGPRKHEVGLRILVRKVQLIAAQYEKALTPVLAYQGPHYYRAFFVCEKGKQKANAIMNMHGTWAQEPKAGPLWLGPLADTKLLRGMISFLEKWEFVDEDVQEKLKAFLELVQEENAFTKIPFYYGLNELGMKKKDALARKGIARTHHDPNAVRSIRKLL